MPRLNAGDDSNPRSGEGGPRKTPAQLATDPAFTGTYAGLLGERFRRAAAKAFLANSVSLGVMATPPTITTGTANLDGTLTQSYRTGTVGTSCYRITGGAPTQGSGGFAPYVRAPVVTMPSGSGGNTSGDSATSVYQWSVEFVTDAPKVMLRYLNTTSSYMVEVNDQPVSATALAYPSTGGTGYTLLDFTSAGGSAIRKFRVEFSQASALDGVYVGPTYTIWAPVDENNLRVAVVGDSIETGTGSTLANGGWSKIAGKLLGWTDVRQVAFGGSGFVNAGSYNTFGAALRIADAVTANPDLLVIAASQNDDASTATLAAATLTALQAYRVALPRVPIVVMGADPSSSGPSATRLSVEAAALSAFTTWADSRSWFIPVSNAADGAWFTGTGFVGSLGGTGNRDRFGSDTAHPNDLGHAWRARRFEAAFKTRVLPYL